MPAVSRVREVGLNFLSSHFYGVAFVVKQDVIADPVDAGLPGGPRISLGPDPHPDLIEEFVPFSPVILRTLLVPG